jgi:DNA-binding NarL/FixJ family response regulator
MGKSLIHILVADDYELWRRFVLLTLQKERELQVVGEASDGVEAIQKAQQLKPDLILLDIGLPRLNGIEAARQIQNAAPASKILFVSENRCLDVVKVALSVGGRATWSSRMRQGNCCLLPKRLLKAIASSAPVWLIMVLTARRPHRLTPHASRLSEFEEWLRARDVKPRLNNFDLRERFQRVWMKKC